MTNLSDAVSMKQERQTPILISNIESGFKDESDKLDTVGKGLEKPISLLLVDADSGRRNSLLVALRQISGLEVEVVHGWGQAVNLLSSGSHFLLIWDERTVEGAKEAAAKLRRLEAESGHPQLLFLLVTDRYSLEDRQSYRSAGIDDFIVAPARLNELAEVLHRWLPETYPKRGLLNRETVEELFELDDGSHEMILSLLDLFRTETPKRMVQLHLLFANGEYRQASEIAHSLKSGSLSMGMSLLSKLCEEIEKGCLEGPEGEERLALDYLESVYEDSCAALEQLLLNQ